VRFWLAGGFFLVCTAAVAVLKTPRDVQGFLQVLAQAALARPEVRHLRRRGRALLWSARSLRARLRLLVFAG
jgi:hypothetical protein